MLKATILTCAIIATQPMIEGAQAGEAMPGALPVTWTGRFVGVTKAPVLVNLIPRPEPKPFRHGENEGDPDIVGSIPPPTVVAASELATPDVRQSPPACALPGLLPQAAGDDLACGGASHNRWSAKAASFNYDLGTVKPAFANALTPYSSWGP